MRDHERICQPGWMYISNTKEWVRAYTRIDKNNHNNNNASGATYCMILGASN
jgi:hypothetical protein